MEPLKKLAEKVALSIISTSVHDNKGCVVKDMIIEKPFDEECIAQLPEEWGKQFAVQDPEKFNHILDVTLEHKLRWYNLEGFCEDCEDHYRFYTNNEIKQMIEDLYNA